MSRQKLEAGHRVLVTGGYDFEPAWLAGGEGYTGTVREFIPGQNDSLAAVVELDEEVVLPEGAGAVGGREVRGKYVVLELAHSDTDWGSDEPRLHVELCDFRPAVKPWQDRPRGAWVESHATYRILQ